MPTRALILLSAALGLAMPALAHAGEDAEAWTPTATALRANAAGISLPQTVGGLSLAKSGEAPPILHQFTKAEAGRKLLSDARFRKRYIGRGEPSDEKYKI